MRLVITGFLALIIFIMMSVFRIKIEARKLMNEELSRVRLTENIWKQELQEDVMLRLGIIPAEWHNATRFFRSEQSSVTIPMQIIQ